jgi:hypothetical protein
MDPAPALSPSLFVSPRRLGVVLTPEAYSTDGTANLDPTYEGATTHLIHEYVAYQRAVDTHLDELIACRDLALL